GEGAGLGGVGTPDAGQVGGGKFGEGDDGVVGGIGLGFFADAGVCGVRFALEIGEGGAFAGVGDQDHQMVRPVAGFALAAVGHGVVEAGEVAGGLPHGGVLNDGAVEADDVERLAV